MLRSPSIDILRIFVVALIVYRHTFGSSEWLLASVGVPFFFFLTGWLWRPGKRTVGEEAGHRWKTLGVPYVAWLVVLYPVYLGAFYMQGELTAERAVEPFLGGSYVGAAYTTFWFISALFAVAVMLRLVDGLPKPVLGLIGVALFLVGGFWGETLATLPLALGVAMPSLGFAILGYLLRDITRSKVGGLVGVSVLPVAVAATFLFDRINIKYGDFGTPLVSSVLAGLIIWGAITLLDALFRQVPTAAGYLSRRLGPMTTVAIVVVLTHPVVLWALAYFMPEPTFGVFVVALVVPWAVAVGLRYTALAPLLIGQTRQRLARAPVPA